MQKINCGVIKCSHNCSGACFANKVDIAGQFAAKDSDTCCASFLDKGVYGDLNNVSNNSSQCDYLVCDVKTCSHNANKLCNLNAISINDYNTNMSMSTNTNCQSFERK